MHLKTLFGETLVIVGSEELLLANVGIKLWLSDRDEDRCIYCGTRDGLQHDHLIPFSLGGSHGLENLVLACEKCNEAKNNTMLEPAKLLMIQARIAVGNRKLELENGGSMPTTPLLPGMRFIRLPSCMLCKFELTIKPSGSKYGSCCTNIECRGFAGEFEKRKREFKDWLENKRSYKFWVEKVAYRDPRE